MSSECFFVQQYCLCSQSANALYPGLTASLSLARRGSPTPFDPHTDCAKLLHEEMAVLNGAADDALLRIWSTVAELSEQLSAHRSAAAELQARIGVLRVCGMFHLVLLGG
jgi:hypothetical protein